MVVVSWIEPMKHFKRNVLYWSERVFVVKARLCATSYFPQSWTNMFEKRANMCSLEETGSNREQLQSLRVSVCWKCARTTKHSVSLNLEKWGLFAPWWLLILLHCLSLFTCSLHCLSSSSHTASQTGMN